MRIIAGTWRGRRLKAPAGDRTRPTSDRVREALFSILGTVDGLRVLDLFAGTGALGLEARSRGAKSVVLVEQDRAALHCLRENAQTLDPSAVVIAGAVEASERRLRSHAPFDLVFVDPPYEQTPAVLALLGRWTPWLAAPDARIIVERSSQDTSEVPPSLTTFDERRYGSTSLLLMSPFVKQAETS